MPNKDSVIYEKGIYERDFYQTHHIIGWTGNIHHKPTVYFWTSDGRFGNITQHHTCAEHIGRHPVYQDPLYSITNHPKNHYTIEHGSPHLSLQHLKLLRKIPNRLNPFVKKEGAYIIRTTNSPFLRITSHHELDTLALAISQYTKCKEAYSKEKENRGEKQRQKKTRKGLQAQ